MTEKIKQFKKAWMLFRQYDENGLGVFFVLAILQILIIGTSVGLPYLFKLLIDQTSEPDHYYSIQDFFQIHLLYLFAVAYALAWFINEGMKNVNNFAMSMMIRNVDASMLKAGVFNFLDLKLKDQRQQDIGVFNANLIRGSEALGTIIFTIFFVIVPTVFKILGMVYVLGNTINLEFGVYFFVFSACTVALSLIITFKTQDIFTIMYGARNQLNQFVIEKLQQSYDIKLSHSKYYEFEEFSRRIDDYKIKTQDTYKKLQYLMIYQLLFVSFFLLVFMVLSVYMFEYQSFSSGDFVLVSTYIIGLTIPLMMMSQNIIHLKGHIVAIDQYLEYFELEHESFSTNDLTAEEQKESEVAYSFQNVTFDLGQQTIENFNLDIVCGKIYLIQGRTGIGKSSFLNYLVGIEKIKSGRLFFRSLEITSVFSEKIFDQIAVVSQTPIVYSTSLRQNLTQNTEIKYSDEELKHWLKEFDLLHLLEKNQIELDDDIQEIYKNFSGGEKQRLNIIRALLKQPELLILDEPTAALDEKTISKILKIIQERVETVIMISHERMATEIADEIIDFNIILNSIDED